MKTIAHRRCTLRISDVALTIALLLVAGQAQAILIQHLDASVPGSVGTDGSGVVTNWDDQSGQGNNTGSRVGAPVFPGPNLSATGLAGVDLKDSRNGFVLFNAAAQDAFLDFSGAAAGNSGFSLLVAFRAETIKGAPIRDVVFANHGNPGGIANSFALTYEGGRPGFFAGAGARTTHSGPLVSPGQTVVLGLNWNQSTSAYEFYSSLDQTIETGNKGLAAGFNLSSVQSLFLGTSENGGQFMNGMIGEVKLWNENLDAAMFEQEADALRSKWVGDPAKLTVDRSTGEVTFFVGNPASPISSYSIRSPGGRIDASQWDSITNGATNGALDSDPWIRLSDLLTDDTEVAEGELPGGDGGVSISAGTTISLGEIWRPSALQDLQMQVLGLNGNVSFPAIEYVGTLALLNGDYNSDGFVDAADYTVWRDNLGAPAGTLDNDPNMEAIGDAQYQTWKDNFGMSLGGALGAVGAPVPEPGALVLAALSVLVLTLRRWTGIAAQPLLSPVLVSPKVAMTTINRCCRAAIVLFTPFLLTASVGNAATPDRTYLLGDNSFLSTENGASNLGGVLGTSPGASLAGVTLDHAIRDEVNFLDASDLTVFGGTNDPTYVDVGESGLGRPGAAGVSVGADFDGDDYVSGAEFGNPAQGDNNQLVNNFNDITTRFLQGWVRPTSAGVPGQRQVIVRDTQQFQIHIDTDESGVPRWGYRYASVDATTDAEVAINAWTHFGQLTTGNTGAILYINGVAIDFVAADYGANAGGESLSLGAEEMGGVGGTPSNFFVGQIDDVDIRVAGNNAGLAKGANWGVFSPEADNFYIASLVADGTLMAGDVNGDGQVNGNGMGLAADDDVRFFLEHYRDQRVVDGRIVGDLESRTTMGDLDYNGITDLRDWYLLVQNHENTALAASLDLAALAGGSQVPEPSAAVLLCLATLGALGASRRAGRRPAADE